MPCFRFSASAIYFWVKATFRYITTFRNIRWQHNLVSKKTNYVKISVLQVCKVSDVSQCQTFANLITMSSENHSITALSLRVSHFQTRRVNTPKLGQLTCFLRDILNIKKTQVIFMGCSWLVQWQKGRDFPQYWTFKKKKSTSEPSFRPPAAGSKPNVIIKRWLLFIVRTSRNTHLSGNYLFQMEGGER